MFRLIKIRIYNDTQYVEFSHGEDELTYEMYANIIHGVKVQVDYDSQSIIWSRSPFLKGYRMTGGVLTPGASQALINLQNIVTAIRTDWQSVMNQMIQGFCAQKGQDAADDAELFLINLYPIFSQFNVMLSLVHPSETVKSDIDSLTPDDDVTLLAEGTEPGNPDIV